MQELKLSVAEILGRPGEYREVSISRPLEGVGVALARVPASSPVTGGLRLESVVEGVLATGRVGSTVAVECARCLKPSSADVSVDVCELFVAPGHVADDDSYRVHGTEIDLEPMLRDALTLALPLNPVCSEDCKGLCATCGRELATGACDCSTDDVDPRWAELDALRAKLEAG